MTQHNAACTIASDCTWRCEKGVEREWAPEGKGGFGCGIFDFVGVVAYDEVSVNLGDITCQSGNIDAT